MPKRTPPFKEYPEWTEAKFFSFIRANLRKAHTKWPPALAVNKEGRREVQGKRHKFEHQCADCGEWFPQKDIEKDHIVPTGSLKSFEDLAGFCERLFVSTDKYRKLCRPCHKIRTAAERKAARERKE